MMVPLSADVPSRRRSVGGCWASIEHDDDEYASNPKSCCSKGYSEPSTAASSPSASSVSSWDDASSSVASEGGCAPDVGTRADDDEETLIQQFLEGMNMAALEVNCLQVELSRHREQRRLAEQFWAVGSARFARSIGAERVAGARPLYAGRRRRQSMQEAIAATSTRFVEATAGGAPETELQRISEALARSLADFQAAQRRAAHEGKTISPDLSSFFEAEDEHLEQMAEANAALDEAARRLGSAKERYQDALAGLESISESIHLRRARSNEDGTLSAPLA